MQNYTLYKTALTLIPAAYLHTVLFTLQADRADEVCAHVDLRQIMSTARHGHHISVPEMVAAQGERKGTKYHWSGSRSYSVPGRQDGGGGQKCRILLVKASRPLRSIDYIEHP